MEGISLSIIVGIVIAFAAVALLCVMAVRKVKNSEDFVIAGK